MDDSYSQKDLHISGVKTVEAGSYGNIHVSGKADMTGPVQCLGLHVSGTVAAGGDLVCVDEASVSGKLVAKGQLVGQKGFKISGQVMADGPVTVGNMAVSGQLSSKDAIRAEGLKVSGQIQSPSLTASTLSVSGELNVRDQLSAAQGVISGSVTVQGDMAVQDLKIYLPVGKGESQIHHIEAKKLFIGNSPNEATGAYISNLLGRTSRGRVVADSIVSEGPADLENTVAGEVRGTDIVIRKGCKIGKVFYTGSLKVMKGAEIGEQNKI